MPEATPLQGERLREAILGTLAEYVEASTPLTSAAPETRDAVVRRCVSDIGDVFAMAPRREWDHVESAARVLLSRRLREAGLGNTISTLIVSAKSGALRRAKAPAALAYCADAAAGLPAVTSLIDTIATGTEAENAVPTDLPSLDDVLNGGLPRAEITLLLAATGAGKTAFALQLFDGASRHDRGLVVMASPEMKAADLWFRIAQRRANVSRRELRPGAPHQSDSIGRILAAASLLAGRSNMVLLDRQDADAALAVEAARALHYSARGPVYLLVLDYAQQLAPQEPASMPRYLAVGSVATDALAFAAESGAAVLLTTQVNAVRGKGGDVVDITVRESAQLEHKAAVSILLVPDRSARVARLSLRKNRHGPIPPPLELSYAPEVFCFSGPSR